MVHVIVMDRTIVATKILDGNRETEGKWATSNLDGWKM
jgi:hypothetical protein